MSLFDIFGSYASEAARIQAIQAQARAAWRREKMLAPSYPRRSLVPQIPRRDFSMIIFD